jgi:hypothetical protein
MFFDNLMSSFQALSASRYKAIAVPPLDDAIGLWATFSQNSTKDSESTADGAWATGNSFV